MGTVIHSFNKRYRSVVVRLGQVLGIQQRTQSKRPAFEEFHSSEGKADNT